MRSFIIIGIILLTSFSFVSADLNKALNVCFNRFKNKALAVVKSEIIKFKDVSKNDSSTNDNIRVLSQLLSIQTSIDEVVKQGYECIEKLSGRKVSDDTRAKIQTFISNNIVGILNECSENHAEEIYDCILKKSLEQPQKMIVFLISTLSNEDE
ncbi:hypothetical protein PVAND_013326 [Polypedilum vanderplanki]|uniref:Secreted protein n=1 Tax=Polypedilum vanderplanki TaxID=319348 RepID=A0A9J6CQ06_POLVA|nr:hypothetical protein PVAND_013326 [Polypedilum vanderplanki]